VRVNAARANNVCLGSSQALRPAGRWVIRWRGGFAVHLGNALLALATLAYGTCEAAGPAGGWTAPVVTQHTLTLGTQSLNYEATFLELPLPQESSAPDSSISATSYVVKDDARQRRPVLFLFNGGPGASSSPLHFNSIGPVRFTESEGRVPVRQLEANQYSVLDKVDLVFIDPVGTGFSRAPDDRTSNPHWGPEGDARACLAMIRYWLREQGREGSPVYIGGESYGGFRLATLMSLAEQLPTLSGLVLISPLLDMTASSPAVGNELAFALDLAPMAVAAWAHDRGDRAVQGATAPEVFDRASVFVRDEYLPALLKGPHLPADESVRLSKKIAAWLGLEVGSVQAQRLRVDSERFLNEVLGQPGKRLGRLDTRVIGSSEPPPAGKPTNDPSLTVSAGPSPVEAYMRQVLRVPIERKYVSLSFAVNGKWNWLDQDKRTPSIYLNPTRHIAAVMNQRPQLKVLYLGGYFDMATTVSAAQYSLEHAGVPMERVQTELFASGHSPYDAEPDLGRFSRLIRAFVGGAAAAKAP